MDMCKLKWTKLQTVIFRVLCMKAGQQLSLRELGRRLKVSPTAVSNALDELEKEKIVLVSKSRSVNLLKIELNRNNPGAIQIKRAENLKMVYECGLAERLYETFPGCTIILFGSYSLGEDISFGKKDEKNSDIDIAVIGKASRVEPDLSVFEKSLERRIIINYYESWGKIHKHLKANILNGITLTGGVDF